MVRTSVIHYLERVYSAFTIAVDCEFDILSAAVGRRRMFWCT